MNSSPNPNKTIEQAIEEQEAVDSIWPGWGGMVVGLADPAADVASVLTDEQQLMFFGCLANEDEDG